MIRGGESYAGVPLPGFRGLVVGPVTVWVMRGWRLLPWLLWRRVGRCLYLRAGPVGVVWWEGRS